MKKRVAVILILIMELSFGFLSTGQTPISPVFTIILEQKGSADGETMVKNVEARYWPCAIWNSGYYGAKSFDDKPVAGAQTSATPEGLFARRGSIAGMKPGEVLLFYVREKSGNGNEGHCSATLSTIGDGIFSWTIVTEDEKETYTSGSPATNRAFGPAGNTNAIIKRTSEGAILTFSEPVLEAEGYCDFFGLFDGNNTPEDISKVMSFTLSNDDLKNWSTLQKVNDQTLNGALGGSLHIRATLRCGPSSVNEAEVALEGCSELSVDEQGQVTATGKPEGGTYRFWAEPPEMMKVEADGANATLYGSVPALGTLYVEYTGPDGNTAQASLTAACIRLEKYNHGEAVPQIAFYDAEGKRLPGIKMIPVTVQPSDAASLLEFVPADPGILTAVGLGDEINLQGLSEGKTTLKAQTQCGGISGPTVDVEVVNCDDETIAKLAEEMRIARENQKEQMAEIGRILGSKEFEEAANNIGKSSYEMFEKTILLVIGTSGATGGVKTAADILDAGVGLKDIIMSDNNLELTSNELQVLVSQFGSETAQTIAGAIETITAADKFGKDLGQLVATDIRLKNAMEWVEKWNKLIIDIDRRQRLCQRSSEQPREQGEPKKDPTPDPVKPTPSKNPKPKTETPPVQEPPVVEPVEDDVPVKGDEIPPPPPASEPKQVGLPYSPSDCGCDETKSLNASHDELSTFQAGMENLGKCVSDFRSGTLNNYVKTLEEWKNISETLGAAIQSGPDALKRVTGEVTQRIDSLIVRTKSFDEAGKAFSGNFRECPKSTESGVDLMRSALKITVETVTTKY